MPALPQLGTLGMPSRLVATAGLRLVASAAIVACCAVFATVMADGSFDASGFHRSRIEASAPSNSDPGCRSRCAAVLRDNAGLRRSLSQRADSLTTCEARAGTLAWELREARLTAERLMRHNAALRRRLQAVPEAARSSAETFKPFAAGLQARSFHAAQASGAARSTFTSYPAAQPFSGVPCGLFRRR
jgi:hypothetical protein